MRSSRAGFDGLFEQVLAELYGQEALTAIDIGGSGSTPPMSCDLALAAVADSANWMSVYRALASTRASRKILVDLNLNIMRFSRSYALATLLKDWRLNKKYYLSEPSYWLSKVLNR